MLFGVYLVSLLKQDDSDVFLIYMEGEPGAMRTCISHTHGRLEVLIMRRLRKRPCQNMGFPLSLVLATSRGHATAMDNSTISYESTTARGHDRALTLPQLSIGFQRD